MEDVLCQMALTICQVILAASSFWHLILIGAPAATSWGIDSFGFVGFGGGLATAVQRPDKAREQHDDGRRCDEWDEES